MYLVTFRSPDDQALSTLRCREVSDSPLGLGFVCLAELEFGRSSRLVDPTAERLQQRFAETKRLHLHIHSVLAIEELTDETLTLQGDRSNLVILPPHTSE